MPAGLARLASNKRWIPARHLLLLNEKLMDVAAGRCKRLIITMPPRHGKSNFVSEYFSAWFIGTFPNKRVILTSYEADFAAEWGMKTRDVIAEWGEVLWGIRLKKDSKARKRWNLESYKGGMQTAGAGGPLTGKGMHLGIIDDPIKNDQEAQSKTIRDKIWNWYRATFYTRLEPEGAIILIQTRWHEDDLAGRLLREMDLGGESWEVLNLPAIAEDQDALSRELGEALWPQRYPLERLSEIQQTIGSYWFNALYQQRPAPEEGNIFKRHWWKHYNERPDAECFDRIIQSWDTAFKELDTSAYVVGQVWGLSNGKGNTLKNKAYLLEQSRSKINGPDTARAVQAMKEKWPQTDAIYIEDKASGPSVIATLREKGINGVIPVQVKGGKEVRASAMSIFVEAGDVYIPNPDVYGLWVAEFIEEFATFPNAEYADQVDAASQAIDKLLAVRTGGKVTTVRKAVIN